MADLNRVFDDEQDHALLEANEDANLDGLLSDQVVMQWLMDLEDCDDYGAADNDENSSPKRMHA